MIPAFRAIIAGLAVLAATSAAHAQQNMNIRGTIAAFDGKQLSVKTKDGATVAVALPDNVNVAITRPFSLADIKPDMPLGVTTVKRADGTVVAIDVRPIPPTAALGLTPYDLAPQATMTNATFAGLAQAPSGNEITLDYKTGTVKALIVPETTMSQPGPGTRDDLKPGEAVYVAARKGDGDVLTAVRVQVGKNGVKPTQ